MCQLEGMTDDVMVKRRASNSAQLSRSEYSIRKLVLPSCCAETSSTVYSAPGFNAPEPCSARSLKVSTGVNLTRNLPPVHDCFIVVIVCDFAGFRVVVVVHLKVPVRTLVRASAVLTPILDVATVRCEVPTEMLVLEILTLNNSGRITDRLIG